MVAFVVTKITIVKKGYKITIFAFDQFLNHVHKTRTSRNLYLNMCFILWKDKLRICFAGFESNLNTNVEPTKAPKLTTSSSKQIHSAGKTSNSFLINETGETVSVTLSKEVTTLPVWAVSETISDEGADRPDSRRSGPDLTNFFYEYHFMFQDHIIHVDESTRDKILSLLPNSEKVKNSKNPNSPSGIIVFG